jgi:hypothetical protein
VRDTLRRVECFLGDLFGAEFAGPVVLGPDAERRDVQSSPFEEALIGGGAAVGEGLARAHAAAGGDRKEERCRSDAEPPQLARIIGVAHRGSNHPKESNPWTTRHTVVMGSDPLSTGASRREGV